MEKVTRPPAVRQALTQKSAEVVVSIAERRRLKAKSSDDLSTDDLSHDLSGDFASDVDLDGFALPDHAALPNHAPRMVAIDLDPKTYDTYSVSTTIRRAGLRFWDNDPPSRIESPDPLKFCDPINVAEAISTSRDLAKATDTEPLFDATSDDNRQWIEVCSYAASIEDAIDRIAERALGTWGFNKRAPGLNPVLAVCIGHGAQALWFHPSMQRLVRVRKESLHLDWKVKAASKVISELVKGFDKENGSAPGPQKTRRSVIVPKAFKGVFTHIAAETRLDLSPLAKVSIMITLSNQPDVHPDDRKMYRELVREFIETIECRGSAAEELLEVPKWKGMYRDSRKK